MNGHSILIIDDDPHLRKTLSDILRIKGFETLTAGNGSEGLSLLGSRAVNLVLLDLGLPDMPGMEILHRINGEFPSTATIILTGNATLDSAIEATNTGAFSYLLKPYDIDQLVLNIRRAIEKQEDKERIIRHGIELEKINNELKILFEVSLMLSRATDLDGLLNGVLQTFADMPLFRNEVKGAAFVFNREAPRLVTHIYLAKDQLDLCHDPDVVNRLYAVAGEEREVIIRPDATQGPCQGGQQTVIPLDADLVLPLKVTGRAVGMIMLQVPADVEIDGDAVKLLSALAKQIGIAVNNALLFEEAKTFSLHDHLTGLPNRRFMQVQLEKSIETAKRYGEKLAAILLDIDNFKNYNDTRGHVEGDNLLVRIADILKKELRSSDFVFRYGGEEFLVILPRTDLGTASEVAERLRRQVEQNTDVTISLGVSLFREFMWDNESLVSTVDAALYQAKQKGKNRVVVNV